MRTMEVASQPTSVGSMISKVSRDLSTPSWWMPELWAKALAPTIALLGATAIPMRRLTRRLVDRISLATTPVWRPK